jgi:hypothetical protein
MCYLLEGEITEYRVILKLLKYPHVGSDGDGEGGRLVESADMPTD